MKRMNNSAVKSYVLALMLRYYGFKPKSGEVVIDYYTDTLTEIRVVVKGAVVYCINCETEYIKGIGFNGFKLDTLEITRINSESTPYEDETDTDTDTDTDTEE